MSLSSSVMQTTSVFGVRDTAACAAMPCSIRRLDIVAITDDGTPADDIMVDNPVLHAYHTLVDGDELRGRVVLLERAVHRVEDRLHFVPWVECRLSSGWGIDRANMQHALANVLYGMTVAKNGVECETLFRDQYAFFFRSSPELRHSPRNFFKFTRVMSSIDQRLELGC